MYKIYFQREIAVGFLTILTFILPKTIVGKDAENPTQMCPFSSQQILGIGITGLITQRIIGPSHIPVIPHSKYRSRFKENITGTDKKLVVLKIESRRT